MGERFVVADSYNAFLRCLNSISEYVTDVDIRSGIIRQVDMSKTWIMEIDLTNIISEESIPIQLLKEKLKLFELLKGQDVTIDVTDTVYSLKDDTTKFTFTTPKLEYLDDKFMSKDEMDQRFQLKEEDLLTNFTITQQMSDRIRVTCTVFNVTALHLVYEGDTIKLATQNLSRSDKVTFMRDIPLNKSISDKVSLITFIPFTLDHDGDIDVKIYDLQNFFVVRSDMKLFSGDAEASITTYCMTELKPTKSVV